MARATASSAFVCQSCATAFPRWEGRCRACGAWNSLVETVLSSPGGRTRAKRSAVAAIPVGSALRLADLGSDLPPRQAIGIDEVDRVLGGGLVGGEVVLLGGEPGIGKSTLVLQVAAGVAMGAGAEATVMYATAEESAAQLRLRAHRLGLGQEGLADRLAILASTSVDAIIGAAQAMRPGPARRRFDPDRRRG